MVNGPLPIARRKLTGTDGHVPFSLDDLNGHSEIADVVADEHEPRPEAGPSVPGSRRPGRAVTDESVIAALVAALADKETDRAEVISGLYRHSGR